MRVRLTAIYGGLFLVCGAALLTITYLLVEGAPFAPPPDYNPPPVSGNGARAAALTAVERHNVLHTLLLRSGIALAIMALISIWLGWIVAGRVLAPLRMITARTHQISEANLHERLALTGPEDEIKELGDTIDGLLARLERAFDMQRKFVSNVSHELRTPLAMMRTSVDVADGKPAVSQDAAVLSGKVREGLNQADRLVESFLVLARAEAGRVGSQETVSLSELADSAIEDKSDALRERRLTVRARLGEAQVDGSRTLLARLVANLVDNGVRYSQPAGSIEITTENDESRTRLVVENDGERLSLDEAQRLIEPFQRLRAARTGSDNGVGLGLTIVEAIAAAHDGRVELRPRPQGGLVAVVEFPRGRPPATNGATP